MQIYAPSSEQPTLDRKTRIYTDEEKEIENFFSDEQNIKKLIEYLSLEGKKGKDKFCYRKLILFKGLFRNHGDAFLENFLPYLEKFVSDKTESVQRCAAEILCGLIRGSKHWSYQMTADMWTKVLPIVRGATANLTTETIADWAMCFTCTFKDRDPHRLYWLLECLMEEPASGQSEPSFTECGRLFILQSSLDALSWKVNTYNKLEIDNNI